MQLAVLILKYGGASIRHVTAVRNFPLIITFFLQRRAVIDKRISDSEQLSPITTAPITTMDPEPCQPTNMTNQLTYVGILI